LIFNLRPRLLILVPFFRFDVALVLDLAIVFIYLLFDFRFDPRLRLDLRPRLNLRLRLDLRLNISPLFSPPFSLIFSAFDSHWFFGFRDFGLEGGPTVMILISAIGQWALLTLIM
jgi:hypothetical protein